MGPLIGGVSRTWIAPRSSIAMLDPWEGGRFSVTPVDAFEVVRAYRPDSNVLEQIFTTASGRARLTDSLNSGISGRLPWSELARRVEGLEGTVEFRIECRPGRRLGLASPWREDSPHGDVLHIDGVIGAFRATDDVEAGEHGTIGTSLVVSSRPWAHAASWRCSPPRTNP